MLVPLCTEQGSLLRKKIRSRRFVTDPGNFRKLHQGNSFANNGSVSEL
jgi:hypothetical protein